MTWNERKSEMGGEEIIGIEQRLNYTEDKLGELSVKIDSVREKSDARITDLNIVYTDMQLAHRMTPPMTTSHAAPALRARRGTREEGDRK
jgi:hypothetical protein